MNVKLKPLREQVIVITGATSGIGLATARMAAGRGARLVLAARSAGGPRPARGRDPWRPAARPSSVTADVADGGV